MFDGSRIFPISALLLLKTFPEFIVEEPNDDLLELLWVVLVARVAAVG